MIHFQIYEYHLQFSINKVCGDHNYKCMFHVNMHLAE